MNNGIKIEKTVPWVVVIALMIQTAGIIWYAGRLQLQVEMNTSWIKENKASITRIIRVETLLDTMIRTDIAGNVKLIETSTKLDEIRTTLQRLEERIKVQEEKQEEKK